MNFLLGTIIGFLVAEAVSGRKSGETGLIKSIKFPLRNKKVFHLHHWMWSMTMIIVFLLLGVTNRLFIGLLVGVFIQGITYRDFYKIIYTVDRHA